jgi:hypothetical protein
MHWQQQHYVWWFQHQQHLRPAICSTQDNRQNELTKKQTKTGTYLQLFVVAALHNHSKIEHRDARRILSLQARGASSLEQ